MAKRILIVEDDVSLAKVVSDNLTLDGFEVAWSSSGHDAPARARAFLPDLILLDIMLPGPSGFDLCQVLRHGGRVPVIMLSARDQKHDKVRGLNLGADDYVTKPFHFDELVARIHAVLRRFARPLDRIAIGDISVEFQPFRATCAGREIHLAHREFEILRLLAAHPGQVVYRDELLREVWGVMYRRHRPLCRPRHRAAPQEGRARPSSSAIHPIGEGRRLLPDAGIARRSSPRSQPASSCLAAADAAADASPPPARGVEPASSRTPRALALLLAQDFVQQEVARAGFGHGT